jgi:hypothetical protein
MEGRFRTLRHYSMGGAQRQGCGWEHRGWCTSALEVLFILPKILPARPAPLPGAATRFTLSSRFLQRPVRSRTPFLDASGCRHGQALRCGCQAPAETRSMGQVALAYNGDNGPCRPEAAGQGWTGKGGPGKEGINGQIK